MKKIYFSQYGYFWLYDLEAALKLCKEAMETGRHELIGRSRKTKPKNAYQVVNCLDFEKEDWKDLLADLEYKKQIKGELK